MSNILIIKHGSLGDLIQANGAIKDIKKHYENRKVFLLTSKPYSLFMSECPYLDGVIIDKRLPRWNLVFLYNLKKLLSKYNFSKVVDLQNSKRTKFYKKFILNNAEWSSSIDTLEPGQSKKDFDKSPVLDEGKWRQAQEMARRLERHCAGRRARSSKQIATVTARGPASSEASTVSTARSRDADTEPKTSLPTPGVGTWRPSRRRNETAVKPR